MVAILVGDLTLFTGDWGGARIGEITRGLSCAASFDFGVLV